MKEYFLIDLLIGFFLLCLWLNVLTGNLQSHVNNLDSRTKIATTSLIIILAPFLFHYTFIKFSNFSSDLKNFPIAVISPPATAFFLFLANLRLEVIRREKQTEKTAKVVIAEIGRRIKTMDAVNPAKHSWFSNVSNEISILSKSFENESLEKLFLSDGGCFSSNLIEWISFFLELQKSNADYMTSRKYILSKVLEVKLTFESEDKSEEVFDPKYGFVSEENEVMRLDRLIERTVVCGFHIISLINLETLNDGKSAQAYIDEVKVVRRNQLERNELTYKMDRYSLLAIKKFIDEDFGKISSSPSDLYPGSYIAN